MRDFVMPKCPEKWTYEERMFYRGIQEALETLAMPIKERDLSNNILELLEKECKVIPLEFATSEFKNQRSDSLLCLRVYGKIVHLQGTITPTKALTSNGSAMYHITTLPKEYAPPAGCYEIITLCQGSGRNIWTLCVRSPDHSEPCTVKVQRYRDGNAYTNMASGNWMPISSMWILD